MARPRGTRWWTHPDLLADHARSVLVCSWRGHRWKAKMSGHLCTRCAAFRRL